MSEKCEILRDLPSNKKGWYYSWEHHAFCCRDYYAICEKCREEPTFKEKDK